MAIELPQVHIKSAGATRLFRVSGDNDMDSGVSFTGTPTVTEVGTSDLTIANIAVTTAAYDESHSGKSITAGRAVQYTVAGGTAGSTYTLLVTCSTDSSPAETLEYEAKLKVE